MNRRTSRRRALLGAGGLTASAAFLAACGSDSDSNGGTTGANGGTGSAGGNGANGSTGGTGATGGASGLLTQPVHRMPEPEQRGGVFKNFARAEPRSLDPVSPQADLNDTAAEVYSTLFRQVPGKLEPGGYELEGDLAESFEISPDGLQITAKLREGAVWHDIAPVNGRQVDAEDVIFALNRHAELAPLRNLVWAEHGGFAMAPEATDDRTIVLKLTEPIAYAPNWFAGFGSYTGQALMYPKEAADPNVLDLRQTMIGTGPFFIKEHNPSIGFTLARNPNYWDDTFALVDEIAMPIIPEYTARQSQMLAGEIHFAIDEADILRAEDVLRMKEDQPQLQMYEGPLEVTPHVMTFGWQPAGENPYKDVRVRRAISMAFDRDLDIDVRFNVREFEAQGIPFRSVWNSHLAGRAAFQRSGFFLDPQGDEFGENARWFQYNPEEARKMLEAAGYPDGFEVKFGYPNASQFDRGSIVEPYFFYLQEIGLTVTDNGYEDYTQGYVPMNRDASGEFEGIGYHSVTGTIPSVISPTSALVAEHLPSSGVTFHGYSEKMDGSKTGDPELISILEKAKVERDMETRAQLVKDAQRHLAGQMWNLLEPGGATLYYLAWPAVQNFRVWDGESVWDMYQLWLDQTKPPFV